VISSGSPFSPWNTFSGGTPTAWASCEWIRTRLKSPWTGMTYLGRVRLSISFSSSWIAVAGGVDRLVARRDHLAADLVEPVDRLVDRPARCPGSAWH
jgi:hypothetical protein